MKIIELHIEGGIAYMLPISLLGIAMMVLFVRYLIVKYRSTTANPWTASAIKQIGLFCFFLGLFGQIVGLIGGFDALEAAGDISPAILAGGLKVSFIPTAYGLFILLLSKIFYFYLTRIQPPLSSSEL